MRIIAIRRLAGVVLAAALGVPTGALKAQSIPSPYRYLEEGQAVTLYGGYLDTDTGERDLGPQSAPVVGVRYNIRFAGPVSGELGTSFMPSRRAVRVRSATGDSTLSTLGEVDAPLLLAEAGLRFQITGPRSWRGFAPFLGATGGLITDLAGTSSVEEEVPEDQRVDFGPAFAVGLSAGTDWYLTRRLSVQLAGRGYLWRFGTPTGFTGREENDWLRALGGSAGVAFHF